jgi:hypothetical protein
VPRDTGAAPGSRPHPATLGGVHKVTGEVDRPRQRTRMAHLQRAKPTWSQHAAGLLQVAKDRRTRWDVLQSDVGEDVVD